MQFSIIQGDIAAQSADVLVNAAGTSLQMGSGVAGALRRRGGEQLNTDAVEQGPINLGEVVVTDAYELDAEYVIHAAAMPHHGDRKATHKSIEDATQNTLERADALGARSIVIPALGCGVAGFDLHQGATIICETIAGYEPRTLEDVRVIAYSDDEYKTIRDVATEYN